jgi:altronate hydrolase
MASYPSAPTAAYRIDAADDVAVALRDLEKGEGIELETLLQLKSAVPRGHKFALRALAAGAVVRKYGQIIGCATSPIAPGEHVHAHNLATRLAGVDAYAFTPAVRRATPAAQDAPCFMGYRRGDGRVGVRNEIWILCTVGCVGRTAERIARTAAAQFADRVDGVHAFPHQFGCSQLGGDLERTRKLIAALAQHPNAGGVLILGLGCESNQLDRLLQELPAAQRQHVRAFAAQAAMDEHEEGLRLVAELVEIAAQARREPCPLSALTIGLKCGGSDGLSGVTANPLLGRVADRLTNAGGAALLTEIPETFGAEHLLLARAANEQVFQEIVALVNDFKAYYLDNGQPVHENPSPGNIEGGITTLEEKSLGAVQKGGHAIVTQVLRYGERISNAGLALLESPGNDGVSSTALVAAGAVIVLFTTGRGTPLGFPAPTLKISSNSALARNKPHWIDFDAGRLLTSADPDAVTDEFLQLIVATASGQPAKNELNDEREIAIWKNGVTL